VIGILRTIFKPAMALLEAFVLATPGTTDDEKLKTFKASQVYRVLAWLVDYLASVKLPVAKKVGAPEPEAAKDDIPKAS
jgi:hypothetical protein